MQKETQHKTGNALELKQPHESHFHFQWVIRLMDAKNVSGNTLICINMCKLGGWTRTRGWNCRGIHSSLNTAEWIGLEGGPEWRATGLCSVLEPVSTSTVPWIEAGLCSSNLQTAWTREGRLKWMRWNPKSSGSNVAEIICISYCIVTSWGGLAWQKEVADDV